MKITFKQKWLLLIATTVLLAACGGHSSYTDSSIKPLVCVAPQVLKDGACVTETMMDSFTKYVSGLLASLFDDKEPIDISSAVVTMPDDKEPEVVK